MTDGDEGLWRRYDLAVEQYRYHLDIAFRIFSYFATTTGALVVFKLNADKSLLASAGLYAVGAAGLVLSLVHFQGFLHAKRLEEEIADVAQRLGLRISMATWFLRTAAVFFGMLYLIVGVGVAVAEHAGRLST